MLEKGTFTELNISSNSLRDEHMKARRHEPPSCPEIQRSHCRAGALVTVTLCAVLEKCTCLHDVSHGNASNNSIGPDGAKAR